jgi:hypothetical protein
MNAHRRFLLPVCFWLASFLPVCAQAVDPQKVAWSLSQPPEKLRLPGNSRVQFAVHTATAASTPADTSAGAGAGHAEKPDTLTLHLVQSSLQDSASLYQIDTADLCLTNTESASVAARPSTADAAAACADHIDLPLSGTRSPVLTVRSTFNSPGTFTGSVSFRLAEQPELQSFKLTVYASSPCRQWAGVLCIALGLAVYFLLNIWLRRSVAIDEALIPAYQLRDAVQALEQRVVLYEKSAGAPLPQLTSALNSLLADLAPDVLAKKLPQLIASPWATSTTWLESLKTYLTPFSDKATALAVLVNNGVRTALQMGSGHPAPMATALTAIDALAPTIIRPESAQTQLAPILGQLEHALTPALDGMQPALATAMTATRFALSLPPDTNTLQIRLLRKVSWVWWMLALIALLAGAYTLVLQNFGFGAPTDFVKCFFWGLGFSVAGAQFEQLTQTSVTASFGISIPKAL